MKRNKNTGFLGRLRNAFPPNRKDAVRIAHEELISAAQQQVKRSAMLGCMHALEQKGKGANPVEKDWWARQTLKWEGLWREINQALLKMDEENDTSALSAIVDASFKVYEQMAIDAVTTLTEIHPNRMKEESKRWRTVSMHLTGLHRHCVLLKYHDAGSPPLPPRTRKNSDVSGIKEMKES